MRLGIVHFLGICLAIGGSLAALGLVYLSLTSPALPYSKLDLYTIDRVTDPVRSGDIQPGDVILSFNEAPFFGCMYLFDAPIYRAPRDKSIPIEYQRPATNSTRTTYIELSDPTPRIILNRSLTHLIAFSFVACGIIILLGGSSR